MAARLLVVDDDHDVADSLRSILEDEGFIVDVANDGREGLEKLQAGTGLPEVVLLDVEMPILTGPGMAYEMFLENCGRELIPVVLLSGVANLREVAEQVGTPYFLGKPYALEALIALTHRALAERTAPRRSASPV